MKPTETRITQVVVCPQGEPLYSDAATTVKITDEAAGEFVEVSQDATGQDAGPRHAGGDGQATRSAYKGAGSGCSVGGQS